LWEEVHVFKALLHPHSARFHHHPGIFRLHKAGQICATTEAKLLRPRLPDLWGIKINYLSLFFH
jgi:hypothetical protein